MKQTFDNFMELPFFLEELFGRKVDLITTKGPGIIKIKILMLMKVEPH
jgi:predicted nucleotidyltransferase